MTDLKIKIIPLGKEHKKPARNKFDCGSESLNTYFHSRITQDTKRNITQGFVAVTPDDTIVGYYTLSASNVSLVGLPEDYKRKLPRYPAVPVARMGRLAVDISFQKKGLGAVLLANALHRLIAAQETMGIYALVVDAKDSKAARFYLHHGFIPTIGDPLCLFLTLDTGVAASKSI